MNEHAGARNALLKAHADQRVGVLELPPLRRLLRAIHMAEEQPTEILAAVRIFSRKLNVGGVVRVGWSSKISSRDVDKGDLASLFQVRVAASRSAAGQVGRGQAEHGAQCLEWGRRGKYSVLPRTTYLPSDKAGPDVRRNIVPLVGLYPTHRDWRCSSPLPAFLYRTLYPQPFILDKIHVFATRRPAKNGIKGLPGKIVNELLIASNCKLQDVPITTARNLIVLICPWLAAVPHDAIEPNTTTLQSTISNHLVSEPREYRPAQLEGVDRSILGALAVAQGMTPPTTAPSFPAHRLLRALAT